jgi:hypothetical protein
MLRRGIGINDDDDGWYCAEHLVDIAVVQLEDQGIVAIEQLASTLVDGETDYLIKLTEDGLLRMEDGFEPTYRDME